MKIADLKVIQKKIKKDYELSLALYDTGNSDAMYLAGLIADPDRMTKADLKKWVKGAYWQHDRRLHGAVGRLGVAVRPGTRAGVDRLGR